MDEELKNLEAELTELGELLRRGWAKSYSVNETQREAFLRVAREEWEKEQELEKSREPSKEQVQQKTGPDPRLKRETERLPDDRSQRKHPEQERGR
jgi:hypothetical protein